MSAAAISVSQAHGDEVLEQLADGKACTHTAAAAPPPRLESSPGAAPGQEIMGPSKRERGPVQLAGKFQARSARQLAIASQPDCERLARLNRLAQTRPSAKTCRSSSWILLLHHYRTSQPIQREPTLILIITLNLLIIFRPVTMIL